MLDTSVKGTIRPLFERGLEFGLAGYQGGEWIPEKAKSSRIEVVPTAGVLIKIRDRKLDTMLYEVFASVFMSELLKGYNAMLHERDFVLYGPQSLKIVYGQEGRKDCMESRIEFFLCPGMPLNKVGFSRKKEYTVQDEQTRVEDRILYLGGVVDEIFRREGVMHGDPQLRHFFLIPKGATLYYVDSHGSRGVHEAEGGLGVIDCESTRWLAPTAQEVKSDSEKFKERLFRVFRRERGEEFFDRGIAHVRERNLEAVSSAAYSTAIGIINERFDSVIKRVDMEDKKVYWK